MGRDKALLPHPQGGTWLEHSLQQLACLGTPLTLLSRWPVHIARAEAMATEFNTSLEAWLEPPPHEGPLLALHRLMERYPDQRLLLAPVDMPGLEQHTLIALQQAAGCGRAPIHLAHDGERSQPLLGIYASAAAQRQSLAQAIACGERRLQRWLVTQHCTQVPLNAAAIRNVNHADALILNDAAAPTPHADAAHRAPPAIPLDTAPSRDGLPPPAG
jgi:molybdopterin-guanine dinucleotide biosynthesis protein A